VSIYCTYTYSDRENKIILVSLSEEVMGGRRKKMLENEKYWNSYIYKYISQCTVNCCILGVHGDREWVRNGGGINLIKAWYIDQKYKAKPPWTIIIQIYT
jgi:hypothetical protein